MGTWSNSNIEGGDRGRQIEWLLLIHLFGKYSRCTRKVNPTNSPFLPLVFCGDVHSHEGSDLLHQYSYFILY